MLSGFNVRIGLPASFAGVAIGIFIAIFEVQGWTMPTPIAVAFIIILAIMIVVALGAILFEVFREALRYLEHRATSASWVSDEEPGLLDYEADGLRATDRLTKEMKGFTKDTQKLGRSLQKHTQRVQDPKLKTNPRLRQKRGNQAGKSVDRSAIYIEKRAALLAALVKDVSRNYAGLISTVSIQTQEDRTVAEAFVKTLETNRDITGTTIIQTTGYRDAVRSNQKQNLGRSLRIASKRLGDALDLTLQVLGDYKEKSGQLRAQLASRLSAKR